MTRFNPVLFSVFLVSLASTSLASGQPYDLLPEDIGSQQSLPSSYQNPALLNLIEQDAKKEDKIVSSEKSEKSKTTRRKIQTKLHGAKSLGRKPEAIPEDPSNTVADSSTVYRFTRGIPRQERKHIRALCKAAKETSTVPVISGYSVTKSVKEVNETAAAPMQFDGKQFVEVANPMATPKKPSHIETTFKIKKKKT